MEAASRTAPAQIFVPAVLAWPPNLCGRRIGAHSLPMALAATVSVLVICLPLRHGIGRARGAGPWRSDAARRMGVLFKGGEPLERLAGWPRGDVMCWTKPER